METAPLPEQGDLLRRRQRPRQKRAERTIDLILEETAKLLAEVGVEGLSTNKVCAAAGVTPPALYRYFPNKYALLNALGERLMERQNAALFACKLDLRQAEISLWEMLRGQYEVTLATTGGAWIMRSLHATPMLAAVRQNSHERATDVLFDRLSSEFPAQDPRVLRRKLRLAVELGYAALEYVFDLPEEERGQAIADAAAALAAQAAQWGE